MARSVAADDQQLAKLKLGTNETLLENKALDASEEAVLKEKILPKVEEGESLLATFDDMSVERIFRGMITNNKGTEEHRIQEAVETYSRVGEWRRKNATTWLAPLKNEEVLFKAMNSTVGGTDLYGHLIWGEKLGDVKPVCDAMEPDHAKAVRMKAMEAIRLTQKKLTDDRGTKRYKQVYVIDLAEVSLGAIMSNANVRAMTKAIMGAANAYFPETMWKCFIINAPFIFRSVYAIVSPFIHPVTKEKIKILAGPAKYLPEMEANGVPKNQLPKALGGDFEDRLLLDIVTQLQKEHPEQAQQHEENPKKKTNTNGEAAAPAAEK
eukprot:CAMPEP_0118913656 /NCGR_PEP_ID=MMETSP1166-20130328/14369_1 /TAXON_ID=1104430 /ORGANISM="Chrysoreinhardia sp, Strain CCMP3193" /LENGTH=322 /DNA_ID=CAMNT_0006853221 /DNA_START=48 /DNA_END=1020 /DNA_ORIENTATION=-